MQNDRSFVSAGASVNISDTSFPFGWSTSSSVGKSCACKVHKMMWIASLNKRVSYLTGNTATKSVRDGFIDASLAFLAYILMFWKLQHESIEVLSELFCYGTAVGIADSVPDLRHDLYRDGDTLVNQRLYFRLTELYAGDLVNYFTWSSLWLWPIGFLWKRQAKQTAKSFWCCACCRCLPLWFPVLRPTLHFIRICLAQWSNFCCWLFWHFRSVRGSRFQRQRLQSWSYEHTKWKFHCPNSAEVVSARSSYHSVPFVTWLWKIQFYPTIGQRILSQKTSIIWSGDPIWDHPEAFIYGVIQREYLLYLL